MGFLLTRSSFVADTTPNAFSFTDQTDVAIDTVITSAAITVAGINLAATVTVSGGEYDVNSSGSFTSSPGTVVNSNTVRARHTSSASNSTQTNTVVTIGGVSDTFTSTTIASGGGGGEEPTLWVNGATGNDSTPKASNTALTPWATIGRAAWGSTNRAAPNSSEAAAAGDVVSIAAGTYNATGTFDESLDVWYNPTNEGSSGNLLTFQAEGTVILTNSGGLRGPIIGAQGRDFIKWSGPFSTNEASLTSYGDSGPCALVTTDGSVIEGCSFTGSGASTREDNYPGIFLSTATNCIIRNNTITGFRGVYGNNHCGLIYYYSGGNIVEHNNISNCGAGFYVKGNALPVPASFLVGSNIIRFNKIWDIEESGVIAHLSPATESTVLLVYQNVLWNCRDAFKIQTFDGQEWDPMWAHFFNNTAYDCMRGMWIQGTLRSGANNLGSNNIFVSMSLPFSTHGPVANFTSDRYSGNRNCYYDGYSDWASLDQEGSSSDYATPAAFTAAYSFMDANSIQSNPLLVDADGEDFHLDVGSPALTLGRVVHSVGGTNGDTIPAGAYITGSEEIGVES